MTHQTPIDVLKAASAKPKAKPNLREFYQALLDEVYEHYEHFDHPDLGAPLDEDFVVTLYEEATRRHDTDDTSGKLWAWLCLCMGHAIERGEGNRIGFLSDIFMNKTAGLNLPAIHFGVLEAEKKVGPLCLLPEERQEFLDMDGVTRPKP